jgi:hypothetical protein
MTPKADRPASASAIAVSNLAEQQIRREAGPRSLTHEYHAVALPPTPQQVTTPNRIFEPPASTSTDATASAASSTNTDMPLNLHG